MKNITVNGIPYVIKFNTKAIMAMGAKGVNLGSIGEKVEQNDFSDFYIAFHEGLKFAHKDITFDEALELLDALFENDGDITDLFLMVMEEMATAMGLGKAYKAEVQKQQKELEKKAKKAKKA